LISQRKEQFKTNYKSTLVYGYTFKVTRDSSSGRDVQNSKKGPAGAPSGMPVRVRRTLRKYGAESAVIGDGYLRR
jgi:hypothetical protein